MLFFYPRKGLGILLDWRIRPMAAIRACACLCAFLTTGQFPNGSCGDPITIAPQNGRFETIDLDPDCRQSVGIPHAIALDTGDREPIFVREKKQSDGACGTLVSTIRDAKLEDLITSADVDTISAPATTADGSIWVLASDGKRYLQFKPDGLRSSTETTGALWVARSISADADDHLLAIEATVPDAKGQSQYHVVDVRTHRILQIRRGEPEELLRGSDGHVYYRLFDHSVCNFFRVDRARSLTKSFPCDFSNGDGLAVGLGGVIWQGGVLDIFSSDGRKSIGPILPFPCTITNTAALTPSTLAANPTGDVWFLYDKLYHVDPAGAISSIAKPPGAGDAGMLLSANGSVWLFGPTALYRFAPAAR